MRKYGYCSIVVVIITLLFVWTANAVERGSSISTNSNNRSLRKTKQLRGSEFFEKWRRSRQLQKQLVTEQNNNSNSRTNQNNNNNNHENSINSDEGIKNNNNRDLQQQQQDDENNNNIPVLAPSPRMLQAPFPPFFTFPPQTSAPTTLPPSATDPPTPAPVQPTPSPVQPTPSPVRPTPSPVVEETDSPTPEPTPEPTEEPTEEPTPEPTVEETPEPTEEPTEEITDEPTEEPTTEPTEEPTEAPVTEPTEEPTVSPVISPTFPPFTPFPTSAPVGTPTSVPTVPPVTIEPTLPIITFPPVATPTSEPTTGPSTLGPVATFPPASTPTIVPVITPSTPVPTMIATAPTAVTATPGLPTATTTPGAPTATPLGGPTITPGAPTTTPGGPTTTPGAPTTTPGAPTITPGGPTITPGGPTITPGGPTVTPGGPTITPGAPTSTPTFGSPTTATTGPSVNATEAPGTMVPSGVVTTPTSTPTFSVLPPSTAPTAIPSTGEPQETVAPTMTGPTSAPTIPGEAINVLVEDLYIEFENVGQLNSLDLRAWERVTKSWFDNFYTEGRGNIRNMDTTISVLDQSVTTGSRKLQTNVAGTINELSYVQRLDYVKEEGATDDPNEVVQLPFKNIIHNGIYGRLLRSNLTAFANVGFPINTPTIGKDEEKEIESSDGDDDGLPLGAIIGIAIGGFFVLALVGFGGYYAFGNKKKDRDGTTGSKRDKYLENSIKQIEASEAAEDEINVAAVSASKKTKAKEPEEAKKVKPSEDSTIGGSVKVDKEDGSYAGKSVDTTDFDYSKVGAGSQNVKSMAEASDSKSADGSMSKSGAYSESDMQLDEDTFVIYAPAGKLGLVVDNPDDGAPVIHAIKEDSVLADQVKVGDRLVGVDEVDVRSLSPVKVSKLISKRSTNPLRKLTLVRAKPDMDDDLSAQDSSKVSSQVETDQGNSMLQDDDAQSEDTSNVGSMSRLSGAEDPLDAGESVEYPDEGNSQVEGGSSTQPSGRASAATGQSIIGETGQKEP